MEAEVQCRNCKQKRWVAWEIRHDGHNVNAEHHKNARCPTCATGSDFTDFTGRHRGEVNIKAKPSQKP